MMNWLSEIFGLGSGKVRQALAAGGVIIDLRPPYTFDQGHIPRSLNIPLDRLKISIGRVRDMKKPVVLCGSGSAECTEAAMILRQAGIDQVYEGGNWQSLLRVIRNN